MAHQPVGAGFSFATNQTSASQTFTVQSDTLRVVAKNAGQHVAIGTTGPATQLIIMSLQIVLQL